MSIKQEKKTCLHSLIWETNLNETIDRLIRSTRPVKLIKQADSSQPTPLVKRIESSEDFSCGKRFFSSDTSKTQK